MSEVRRGGTLAVLGILAAACWPPTALANAGFPWQPGDAIREPTGAVTDAADREGVQPTSLLRTDTATNLTAAKEEILGWVAAETHPTHEWERLFSQDPDTAEHNFRVAFAVNYALLTTGAQPGKDYTSKKFAEISEKALWTLTRDLRGADPKIHTSESLLLRDAQRYLYGSLGDKWLQQHVATNYGVPGEIARYIPGWVIDRGYEDVVKPVAMIGNAVEEEVTGKNPGWGRLSKNMPNSRPGGDAWYVRGLTRFKAMNPNDGSTIMGSPFFVTAPPREPTVMPLAVRWLAFWASKG